MSGGVSQGADHAGNHRRRDRRYPISARACIKVDRLGELGVEISCADAFNDKSVLDAIDVAKPDVLIDQSTSLPASPDEIIEWLPNDTHLRGEGGANLLSVGKTVSVATLPRRLRGFYLDAPDGELANETAKLRVDAASDIGNSARPVNTTGRLWR